MSKRRSATTSTERGAGHTTHAEILPTRMHEGGWRDDKVTKSTEECMIATEHARDHAATLARASTSIESLFQLSIVVRDQFA